MTTVISEAAPSAPAMHRAEVATSLPPARGQSFLKLVVIELRKAVNTRSGRVLIAAILLLAVVAIGWQLTHLPPGPAGLDGFLGAASTGAMLLLPVIGVMAMTSEWTQRTALTTFTLSPRRVRVQLAKFVSAIVLSVVVMTGVVLLALAGTALAGAVTDHTSSYAGMGGQLAGAYLTVALNVVMGAAPRGQITGSDAVVWAGSRGAAHATARVIGPLGVPAGGRCVCRSRAPGILGPRLLTTDPWAPRCVPG